MATGKKSITIRMINMTFYGFHGASAAEKETGRRFEVDCEIAFDADKAVSTDSLENTINYTDVYRIIEDLMENSRYNLVETLAEKIADKIFSSFAIERLKLKVRKRNPPVPGNIDAFEVETERFG